MEVNKKIISMACDPISETDPCGVNAKYEAPFEQLEAEISKSESLNSESTDWHQVLKLSEEILTSLSKDYTAACYLAYAYLEIDGYKGLLNGLTLIEKLSESYWDGMYPPKKRLRGRQNSSQWLIEKISGYISTTDPSDSDMVFIADIAKTLKSIDYFLIDKMDDKAPDFSEISRPIKRLKEIAAVHIKQTPNKPEPSNTAAITQKEPAYDISKQQVEKIDDTSAALENAANKLTLNGNTASSEDVKATVTATQKSPTPLKSSSFSDTKIGDLASDTDAKKAYKQIQDGLKKLANYYAQVKPSDPKRFRLSRSALWDSLDKLPPATDNKCHLPAPPADKLKKVKDLFESGDFIEAINLAEKSAEKMPYWFEGNRYISMSLDALGAEYAKAKTALEYEITKFTSRLPKILDLQYANGIPFADDQTKSWITSLSRESSNDVVDTSDQDEINKSFVKAKKLALSGKLSQGFAILNSCTANTKRDHFKIKMACAELACINGQEKVGIPMLERLVEETRTLTAAEWESDFLAKALALLVNAYEKLNDEKSLEKQKQIDAVYDQLCWYNPALLTE